jgi:hypothetical protein
MDKDLDLNKGGALPDRTGAANSGGFGATSADLTRGFSKPDEPNEPKFSDESDGGGTVTGNPLARGGFAGRPLGWAR